MRGGRDGGREGGEAHLGLQLGRQETLVDGPGVVVGVGRAYRDNGRYGRKEGGREGRKVRLDARVRKRGREGRKEAYLKGKGGSPFP